MDQLGSDISWVKEIKNKVCEINKRVQEMIDKRSTKLREPSKHTKSKLSQKNEKASK